MLKKIICLGAVLIMCLGLLFGCETTNGEEKPTGKFYTLQEAYDQGLLTVDDLQSIANYFNNNITPADALSVAIETAILETAAENLRNEEVSPIAYAKADDFLILKYLGTYNKSVAAILNAPYSDYPAEIVDYWFEVAGVSFNQRGHEPITIYK